MSESKNTKTIQVLILLFTFNTLVFCDTKKFPRNSTQLSTQQNCSSVQQVSVSDILKQGQNLYGDDGTTSPFPCWFDPELARIGQRFAHKYQSQISLAHLLSLLMLLGNQQVNQVMYATNRSDTPGKAFKRYTATGLHVRLWYSVDILNPTWLKSVKTIRNIHNSVGSQYKAMNKDGRLEKPLATEEHNPSGFYPDEKMWTAFNLDLEASKYNPKLQSRTHRRNLNFDKKGHKPTQWYNQYLMTITQWSFVGMPILFPRQVGIPHWTDLELRGFYHLWAVISHVLGHREEFILCRDPRDLNACKKRLREVYEEHIIPSIFDINFQGKVMIEAFLRAPKLLVPAVPVDFMLIQVLEDILEIPTPNLYAIAGWQTRIGRFFGKHFAEPFFHWPLVQKISNFILSGEIQVASKRTFGDAGTNSTAVAEQYYVLDR